MVPIIFMNVVSFSHQQGIKEAGQTVLILFSNADKEFKHIMEDEHAK